MASAGTRRIPRSVDVMAAEAERFLRSEGSPGATVWRLERPADGIYWVLWTSEARAARHTVLAGSPGAWSIVTEGTGWPVPD